jgi:hypothetical protein
MLILKGVMAQTVKAKKGCLWRGRFGSVMVTWGSKAMMEQERKE